MTNYILFEVDDIDVDKSHNGFCIRFKKDSDRAAIYLTEKWLNKLSVLIKKERGIK